jgi:hypothetical protein
MSLLDDIYIAQRNAGEEAVMAHLAKSGLITAPAKPPPALAVCNGPNCGSTDGRFHSRECWADYDANCAEVRRGLPVPGLDGTDA